MKLPKLPRYVLTNNDAQLRLGCIFFGLTLFVFLWLMLDFFSGR